MVGILLFCCNGVVAAGMLGFFVVGFFLAGGGGGGGGGCFLNPIVHTSVSYLHYHTVKNRREYKSNINNKMQVH